MHIGLDFKSHKIHSSHDEHTHTQARTHAHTHARTHPYIYIYNF